MASLTVPGDIADSRVVGEILYLASYENAACYGCGTQPRTLVTSFDVSNPSALRQVDQLSFQSNAPDGYNLPWGTHWTRSIFATDERLYVGGHADVSPTTLQSGTAKEGIIDVVDVTDPGGHMLPGARLSVAGASSVAGRSTSATGSCVWSVSKARVARAMVWRCQRSLLLESTTPSRSRHSGAPR